MRLDERNDELNKKISETDLPNAVATLITDAKKRKRQLIGLTVSLVVDVLLTLGFGFLAVQTHATANKSESNQQALVSTCEATNEARANNKMLWNYLLDLPTPNAQTLQQKQVRDKFSAFVDKTFAPKDCSTIIEK